MVFPSFDTLLQLWSGGALHNIKFQTPNLRVSDVNVENRRHDGPRRRGYERGDAGQAPQARGAAPDGSLAEVEHVLGEPLGGDLAVPLLDLDADGVAAEVFRCAERGAAAHEGVEDG